jgi:hypothetical protein
VVAIPSSSARGLPALSPCSSAFGCRVSVPSCALGLATWELRLRRIQKNDVAIMRARTTTGTITPITIFGPLERDPSGTGVGDVLVDVGDLPVDVGDLLVDVAEILVRDEVAVSRDKISVSVGW